MGKGQIVGAAVCGGILLVCVGVHLGVHINSSNGPSNNESNQMVNVEPAAPRTAAPVPVAAPARSPVVAKQVQPPPVAPAANLAPPPTAEQMRALGTRVASGDATALVELEEIHKSLY